MHAARSLIHEHWTWVKCNFEYVVRQTEPDGVDLFSRPRVELCEVPARQAKQPISK